MYYLGVIGHMGLNKLRVDTAKILFPFLFSMITSSNANNLPELGGSVNRAISVFEEYQIGRKIYFEIKKSSSFYDSPELEDYLSEKINKIIHSTENKTEKFLSTKKKQTQIKTFILLDDSLNAFALPGNFIGVHTGLFKGVRNEGELISVLSHELAHLTQRHIARMYSKNNEMSGLLIASAILSAIAAGSSNGDAAAGILSLSQTIALQKRLTFSRQAEREADRVGLRYLQKAGYQPVFMAEMLENLQLKANIISNSSISWLRTHPLTFERIADVNGRINKLQINNKVNYKNYKKENEIFNWLRVSLKNKKNFELNNNHFSSQVNAKNLIKNYENEKKIKEKYEKVWENITNENYSIASLKLNEFKKNYYFKNKKMLVFFIAMTEATIAIKEKKFQDALTILDSHINKTENRFLYRKFLRLKIEAFSGTGNWKALEATAKKIIKSWPSDTWVWNKLANSSNSKGEIQQAHFYTAEKYVTLGMWKEAIEQLQFARIEGQDDFIFLSKIDSRIKEIKKEFKKI